MRSVVRSVVRSLLAPWHALRPCPACLGRATTSDGVCGPCRERWFGPGPVRARDGDRSAAPPAELVALGAYRGDLGRLVRAAKYRPDRRLLALLGTALGHHLGAVLVDHHPACIVVPVPGDRGRIRRRGLDHAHLVATAVAASLGPRATLRPGLHRLRRTRPQAHLGDGERRANLEGAIAWRADPLGGATVVLVDDVLTTGATARACAAALAAAGAGRVVVAVAARAR